MAFHIEKDWTTVAGYRAVVIRHTTKHMKHRCGYVAVPNDSSLANKDYNDVEVEVHGGLTYSDRHEDYPVPSDVWWFGYDTGHYNDDRHNGGQPLEYCVAECESMARQLKQLEQA